MHELVHFARRRHCSPAVSSSSTPPFRATALQTASETCKSVPTTPCAHTDFGQVNKGPCKRVYFQSERAIQPLKLDGMGRLEDFCDAAEPHCQTDNREFERRMGRPLQAAQRSEPFGLPVVAPVKRQPAAALPEPGTGTAAGHDAMRAAVAAANPGKLKDRHQLTNAQLAYLDDVHRRQHGSALGQQALWLALDRNLDTGRRPDRHGITNSNFRAWYALQPDTPGFGAGRGVLRAPFDGRRKSVSLPGEARALQGAVAREGPDYAKVARALVIAGFPARAECVLRKCQRPVTAGAPRGPRAPAPAAADDCVVVRVVTAAQREAAARRAAVDVDADADAGGPLKRARVGPGAGQ
jgi:hypothetical protein